MLEPLDAEFCGDAATLGESKEVNAVREPGAVRCEVSENGRKEIECWGRVGVLDHLAKISEGGVPLEGVFIEKRDPATTPFRQCL